MEDRVLLWGLLSCLLAPITVLGCHHTWGLVTGTIQGGNTFRLATYVLVLASLKTQHSFFEKWRFELRARRLGCKPARIYPHGEYLIGWGFFKESLRALAEGRILDVMAERFEAVGHTYWSLALGQWMLLTDEPENLKAILASSFDDWAIGGPRLDAVLPQLGPKSIFASNGSAWHAARAMIRPSFVRDQVADLACFDRHAGNLITAIRAVCGEKGGRPFDVQELLHRMTMDSSTDFMLGHSTDSLLHQEAAGSTAEFLEAFDYVAFESSRRARLGPFLMSLWPNRRFSEDIKKIRSFINLYVAQSVQAKELNGKKERTYVFLDQMMKSGASEDYIADQVLSIILAGRDTTAGAISAIIWFLARSPSTVEKLRAEMEHSGIENPTWEELKGMKYLQNVVKEGLRLFPPAPVNSRLAIKETVFPRGGGPDGKSPMLVPAGTFCRWSFASCMRRKDFFGPDANDFRPERWDGKRTGWEYVPFSGGPRICIGQQFALTQVTFVLFRLLQNFSAIEPMDPRPFRVAPNVAARLANGCLVSMTPM